MSDNSWPGGKRHAMSQAAHEEWNASNYPGTRQLCSECGEPTGRCEDDSLFAEDEGPFCESCFGKKRSAESSVAVQCEDTHLDMFSELAGERRLIRCTRVAKWEVAMNPPSADNDGKRRLCDLCNSGSLVGFTRERIKP